MGDTISDLTGGLLGGGSKTVVQKVPIREREADKPKADASVDPSSDAVAEARRRHLALGRRTGRSALRVNLDTPGTQTRSGISIG